MISDWLIGVNGSKTVATLQLSGNYVGQTFSVGSDGKRGSTITISAPGGARPALFAQAMAAFGGGAGEAPAHATPSPDVAALTRLATPGTRPTA